jgi:hypothetical protein
MTQDPELTEEETTALVAVAIQADATPEEVEAIIEIAIGVGK